MHDGQAALVVGGGMCVVYVVTPQIWYLCFSLQVDRCALMLWSSLGAVLFRRISWGAVNIGTPCYVVLPWTVWEG
jgi:hypothetical protein